MRETIFLQPWGDASHRVEMLLERPQTGDPRPAVLLMHGHQEEEPRPGAFWTVRSGYLQAIVNAGFVGAAVSMPGYGRSEGAPDFCGPRSQAAVRAGIARLRSDPCVMADHVGLCGWSRGAIVSSLVAAAEPELACVVLISGVYDFFDPQIFVIREIEHVFIEETRGGGPDAKRERSALLQANQIHSPTLFVHGDRDERIHAGQAAELHEHLVRLGRSSRLVTYPETGHRIPSRHLNEHVLPFLKETLGSLVDSR